MVAVYQITQNPQESIFIMFVCEFQSTNISLLKMAENINQKTVENKSYHINLREEQKAKHHMGMTTWLKIKI